MMVIYTLVTYTRNRDCVYSWGYQIWKQGSVVFEEVYGLAGKRNPLGSMK